MEHSKGLFKPLSALALISQGHLFRKGIDSSLEYDVYLIQSKDLDERGRFDPSELLKVSREEIKDSEILGPKDVLLRSKTRSPSAVYVEDLNLNYTPTSHFFIIRLKTDNVSPRFLTWYLNTSRTGTVLASLVGGTNVPFLRKRDLLEVEIPIPPMKVQKKIIQLNELREREEDLMKEIGHSRKELVESVCMRAARGE